ncbi:hypothetical protein [Marinivivus vitaminiproducens]|uniref:hypothetical protein n=1 Tax=Marinivivus vitaminiproducens TaxID=3035935 RepID=UPI002797CA81|nr:hypothetical protein P4R82_09645 [Geminicoccaceae bacterium SCSIO 64248]
MRRSVAAAASSATLMLALSSCLTVQSGGTWGGGGWNGGGLGGWGGAGWSRPVADREDTIAYRCDDDRRFAARFEGDRVIVGVNDNRYQLQRSGPGRWRNGGGSVVLRADGDRAELKVGDRDYEDCRAVNGGRGDSDYGRTIVYRCDDDRRFAAAFSDRRAIVEARDRRYRLERTGSHSWRDDDGDVRLEADGRRAELRVGDRRYRDCRAVER